MRNEYGKNVFITGASGGIGRACAKALAKKGCHVVGVSRNCKETYTRYSGGGSIRMLRMDVTDRDAIKKVISKIKRIDIAILSAGMGVSGSIEDIPMSYARKQMEVVYFGVLNVCKELLPLFRKQKRGYIIVIGSVAGRVSIPMQSHYSSAKYALEAYVDALRLEMKPYGVNATIVEPGDTRTGFTKNRKKYIKNGSPHNENVIRAVGRMEEDERNGASPDLIAKAVLRLVCKKNPPARTAVGIKYKILVFLIKLLPDMVREKVVKFIYLR